MKYYKETKITHLEGHIEIEYRDVTLTADRAEIDEKQKVVVARGRVVFSDPKNEIIGSYIFYNYDAEYFEILEPSGTATSANVKGKVYYTGKTASGTRQKIKVRNAVITTCAPYCRREYHITAKDITVYPEKKIIARKAAFFIGNRRSLYFPVYVMSLKDEQMEHVDLGYNEQDGFYLIVKYPFMTKENIDGWFLLDHRTKRGNEIGNEYKYTLKSLGGDGEMKFSNRNDKLSGRSENKFFLKQDYSFGATKGNFRYDRNSSLPLRGDPINTNSINFNLNRTSKSSTHNVNLVHTAQHSRTESANTSLNYNQTIRYKKYTATTLWNFADTGRKGFGRNKNLVSNFSLTRNRPVYNTTIKMIKSFDVDGDSYKLDNNEYVSFTQPEISLNFNMATLKNKIKMLSILPLAALSYTYGKYTDGPRHSAVNPRSHVSRKMIDATLSKSFQFGKRTTLTPSHNFTQFLYSTSDAMYAIHNTVSMNYNVTTASRLAIIYNNVRDSGGIPITRDRRSDVNNVNASFSMNKLKTSFQINTTYNYRNYRYTPLVMNYNRGTSKNSQFNLSSTYDLENDLFGPTNTGMTISRKNTKISLTSEWDTEELELRRSQITFDISRKNGWKYRIFTQYDGVGMIKLPFIRQVNATKTNCCTEIQMSYNTDISEFQFQYVILAFPSKRLGVTSGDKGLEFKQNLFEGTQPGQQTGGL